MNKVLHVVSSLHHGAVEKWLMSIYLSAHQQSPEIEWTFYCVMDIDGEHETSMRQAGATVIHACSGWSKPVKLMRELRNILKTGGYDVLHAHHDLMSAIPLVAAIGIPIKKRWVHVHNADCDLPTSNKLKIAIIFPVFRWLCLSLSDGIIGITKHTLKHFVGKCYPRKNDRVIYYGVDTKRFRYNYSSREAIRQEFNIPIDSQVMLFTARMNWFKNPCFIIEMLKIQVLLNPMLYVIFVGEGEMVPKVEALAEEYGLKNRVRIAGWREDSERFFSAADLFVFPRIEANIQGVGKEGLGLTLIEAQTSGLTILTSFGVSDEAKVVSELFYQLPIDSGAENWANQANNLLKKQLEVNRSEYEQRIETSSFGLNNGTARLLELY